MRKLTFLLGLAALLCLVDAAEAGGGRLFGRRRAFGCSGGTAGFTYGGCSGMSAGYYGGMGYGDYWGGSVQPSGGYHPGTGTVHVKPPAPPVSDIGYWHWHEGEHRYHWHAYGESQPADGGKRKK